MQLLAPLALTCTLVAGASAQQVVLDFEDLSGFAPMPAGYGGVADWGSWAHSDTPDNNYPPASGVVRIFSVGPQARIQFGQDVVFDGANVVTALPFSWNCYYQGQLVASSAVLQPNTGGPAVWLASGYAGLVDELEYDSAVNVHAVDDFTYTVPNAPIGTNYCTPAVANSTGFPGALEATGSDVAADNDVTLEALDLPLNQFGYFLNSQTQGFTQPGNSQGNLCITGQIGRYNASIFSTGASGTGSLVLDLTMTPTPSGSVAVIAGDTWNFTCWYRDVNPTPTSNFTDAVEIQFQ